MAKASAQHPWIEKYPSYLDWNMDIQTGTLPQLWDEAVSRFGDRPLMDFLGNKLTYAETDALVAKFGQEAGATDELQKTGTGDTP